MKKYFSMLLMAIVFGLSGCGDVKQSNSNTELSPTAFAEKIKEFPEATIIDVRTADEFNGGHLQNAVNLILNSEDFQTATAKMDKSKPVFIYCLSGGRSSAAAQQLRTKGFVEVYELSGGLMSWRANSLPESDGSSPTGKGMTNQQFNAIVSADKLVLVDFYADWCAPCKQMEPYINEISATMAAKVNVVRINADENPELCKSLNIEALPTLQLYKNKKIIWNHIGFIEKSAVLKQLN